ncbi:MAG: winged helix-turn-helix domain-containing protein, partial [Solirubrobacterales bacterium]|nr:winged helix-turn-helix domain-containing protein [Solirubrobacterales bacterium]
MGATLELGMLGPIEVRSDRAPVSLGGPRQRALLADLALHPNQVVSVDRLVDDLWGEAPPATAVHTIQVFVSRLRRALGAAGERLLTRPPGYMLVLHADEVDADRFERLYDSARSALGGGDADQALGLLEQATALWRGPALDEFTYEPFAQAAIARLEELRVSAREDLIEAQLALGRHDEVVSDLEALIHEHPFRERPRAQLMLALYRCGRQAQALDAFRQARHALVEELGVEPGEALRELEQAILRQDPSLRAPASGRAAAVEPGASAGEAAPHAAEPEPDGTSVTAPTVRRTVTVLVARLCSVREADPETTRSSIGIARKRAEDVVARHGGAFVAGLGDEVAWVFGLPLVREDDALRALHAADELRGGVESTELHEPPGLTVHIGLATGEVIADSPRDVFGDP